MDLCPTTYTILTDFISKVFGGGTQRMNIFEKQAYVLFIAASGWLRLA